MITQRRITIALLAFALGLLSPLFTVLAPTATGRVVITFGVAWFALNTLTWLVPKSRRALIERRGPLIGFGFAFAAALVSTVMDGFVESGSVGSGVILFLVRFVLLLAPFVYPYVHPLPRQAHLYDMVVIAYAFILAFLPVFSTPWINPGPSSNGILVALTASNVVIPALIATYFYGVRWWSEMVIDIKLRNDDTKIVVRTALYALTGVIISGLAASLFTQARLPQLFSLHSTDAATVVATIITGLILGAAFQEIIFRGILFPGLKRLIGPVVNEKRRAVLGIALMLVIAGLHAFMGVYALSPVISFGFSTGVGVSALKTNRLLPLIAGHAAAWTAIMIMVMIVF